MALADIVASNHDVVRRRIPKIFLESCRDAEERIADVPVRQKYPVFQSKLRGLLAELEKLLSAACEEYTGLAIGHRSEIEPDLWGWVKAQVKTDREGVTRDRLAQWVRDAVGLEASLYPPLPAWIVDLPRKRDLGHPQNVDLTATKLGAALTVTEAEETQAQKWMIFEIDLDEAVARMIQACRVKLAAAPTSNPGAPTQDEDTGQPVQSREKLARKIHDPNTATVTHQQAADWYDVSRKTIREWKANGKLQGGQKRGTVTTASILALDAKSDGHRS
jgi:hypothetical protein